MVPLLRLLALLRLLLTQPAAVQASSVPELISVAELQSSTVRPPTGGGTVWVLGRGFAPPPEAGADAGGSGLPQTVHGVEVRLADAAGALIPGGVEAPLAIEQAVEDSMLLVNLGAHYHHSHSDCGSRGLAQAGWSPHCRPS